MTKSQTKLIKFSTQKRKQQITRNSVYGNVSEANFYRESGGMEKNQIVETISMLIHTI